MSVRSRKLHWNDSGDPVLTIEAVGIHDVYRLANHMQKGQCEFGAIGRRIERGLRRHIAAHQWTWLLRYMHGDGGF